jgi:hypothetical protein
MWRSLCVGSLQSNRGIGVSRGRLTHWCRKTPHEQPICNEEHMHGNA